MENEAKRAKRGIIIAFSVLVCILLVIAVIFFMYRSQHTFSQEKWLSNASERYMIVDDMLENTRSSALARITLSRFWAQRTATDRAPSSSAIKTIRRRPRSCITSA